MTKTTKILRPRRRTARLFAIGVIALISLSAGAQQPAAQAVPPPSPTATPEVTGKAGETASNLPKIPAWTWIVADADTGAVLAGRDWHWRLPPASTLKTLTALTLVPRLDPASTYIGQPADVKAEGSKVGIEAGASYAVSDLEHGMLLPSGNDAASALANAYGGLSRTVAAMNDEAGRLGAKDTHAVNASGLDAPGQVTSAYDLALILRESLKNPELSEIYKLHHTDFPAKQSDTKPGKPRGTIRIWTENRLILNAFPGALGGKTGFTSQAGRTFVAAVERDGRRLIVALMRTAQSTERISKRLIEWGFANIDNIKPLEYLAEPQAERADISRQPAAEYDAAGNLLSVLPSTAVVNPTLSVPMMLLLVLVLAACVLVVLRVRAPARPATGAARWPDDQQHSSVLERVGPGAGLRLRGTADRGHGGHRIESEEVEHDLVD